MQVCVLCIVSCVAAAARAGIRPVGADAVVQYSASYDPDAHTYTLSASGEHVVTWLVDLDDAALQAGMLRLSASLDRGPFRVVLTEAGTRYRDVSGAVHEPDAIAPAAGASLVEHRLDGQTLVLRWSEQPGAHPLEKTFRLTPVGYALRVRIGSDATWGLDGYAGASLGHAAGMPDARVVQIPYLPEAVALLPGGEVMTAFFDPSPSSSVSTSSTLGVLADGAVWAHGRTLAQPDTAGVARPLDETGWITLADDLADVYPRVVEQESPYRSVLSPLLVLDVWGLHRSYGVPEGVAVAWESPVAGPSHLAVRYADQNPACGDGVAIVIRHDGAPLARLPVANGETQERTWEADPVLSTGDVLRFEIDRAGDNNCDATLLQATIDTGTDTFDSSTDFSSVQGQRGFSWLEFVEAEDLPMAWDADANRWQGQSAYALLWAGGGHPGAGKTGYLDAASMIRRYVEYGLVRLAVIFHVWQRWGYDQGLPDHHPANPALGSGAEMAAFVSEAVSAGMLIALHENYTDIYPDNPPDYPSPLWDPDAIALNQAGERKLGWYHQGTGQQAFVIKDTRMQSFADMESPSIAADYGPNAAYLDVTTGWSPGRAIDHDAADGANPTLAHAHAATVAHFEAMKAIYGGPLFGEGGEGPRRYDSYFAGHVDAVERQTEGRMRARVLPDYELRVVRPRMFNHGQGYYSRYFVGAGHETPALEETDLDQYRASEIAFGHAGFLGDAIAGVDNWMHLHAPEYWLMQGLQSRYAEAGLDEVSYFHQGGWLDTEQALRARLDLSRARLRIRYDNGLVVYVNRDSPSGGASSFGDFSHEQGLGGWRYLEDTGSGPVALAWDPARRRWQGDAAFSFIDGAGGHPDGGAIVRNYTVGAAAALSIRAGVEDLDTSCGDGVMARLQLNGADLWTCDLPGDVASACPDVEIEVQAEAGDVLGMRVEQKGDNWCDSTAFLAEIEWDDGVDHDWPVDVPGGMRTLPPSGFYAHDDSGFVSGSVRPDGSSDAIVDLVESLEYRFARSRDGVLRTIGDFSTDGAIAVVHGPGGDDLHALHLTRAELDGDLLVLSSVRADVNLRFLDERRALLTVRDPEGGAAADITWGALPPAWRDELAIHPGHLEWSAADARGNPVGDLLVVSWDPDENPVLAGIEDGQHYLLHLVSGCVEPPCCGDGNCETDLGENCGNCPGDCPVGPDQVCCQGDLYDGDCCDDGDCPAGSSCVDHVCSPDTDGGMQDGAPDAETGKDGEDAGALDGGVDAGVPDGGADAADVSGADPSGAGDGGCGCGGRATGAAWLLWALACWVWRCRAQRG